MREREEIMAEIWKRLSSVSGMIMVTRNPSSTPNVDDLPISQLFDFPDTVLEQNKRGSTQYPSYIRQMNVVIETYIKATSEGAATKELGAFIQLVKAALYQGGPTFGGLCSWVETESSRVLRPPVGENIIGIGLVLQISYIEDISALFS